MPTRYDSSLTWLFVLLLCSLHGQLSADEITTLSCCCEVRCAAQGAWYIADSPNFQACSLKSREEAVSVARHCEQLRKAIQSEWAAKSPAWQPRCQILLHRTQRAYVAAAGVGSEATLASALVQRKQGRIAIRRIDLRTDVKDFFTAALPHELCHVVLADLMESPPLWLNEGLAIMADPAAKQALHERDYQQGLRQRTAFTLQQLVSMNGYPSADRWGVFYGESASLVRYLLERQSPGELIRFADSLDDVGINLAIHESYGVSGALALERQWRNDASVPTVASLSSGTLGRSALLLAMTGAP